MGDGGLCEPAGKVGRCVLVIEGDPVGRVGECGRVGEDGPV